MRWLTLTLSPQSRDRQDEQAQPSHPRAQAMLLKEKARLALVAVCSSI